MTTTGPDARQLVLAEIYAERDRQDAKFGKQNHPDGTGGQFYARKAASARRNCQLAAEDPEMGGNWALILLEEVYEALAESDPAKLRAELIQIAAVATAWTEAIDRRTTSDQQPRCIASGPSSENRAREQPARTPAPPDREEEPCARS